MELIGDGALTAAGESGRIFVSVPSGLSRSLTAAGYNRVRFYITEEGILLKPYTGEKRSVDPKLPKWSDE